MSDNSLIKKNMETSLQYTSLSDLVKASEEVFLLIDTSGSMACAAGDKERDKQMQGLKYRRAIDCLRDVVKGILTQGHVPMIAFGGPYDAQVRFVDDVPEPLGGTPLHLAIPLAKEYGANRLVVISDGMPDLRPECINQVKLFGGRIDAVYIGKPGDGGDLFMQEIAKLTGGTASVGDITETLFLTSKIIGLLEGEVASRGPIQGPGFSAEDAAGTEPDPDDFDNDLNDDEDDDDDDDEDDDEE